MQSTAGSENVRAGGSFDVRKARLGNGLVVVTERMAHVRSISFGVFLGTGSRHEAPEQHGLTHFIEHAVFKGSRKRSAARIAAESDALGGRLDAFTGREMVGFSNKVLDEHLPRAFDLVADLVTNPAFDPGELEKERNVILEEIKMVEDTPDDIIFDLFCETFYPDHPLGRTILGTPASLATFEGDRIRQYYDAICSPENMVIAVAGNLDHERMLEMAEAHYGHMKPAGAVLPATTPEPRTPLLLRHKAELEQAHLLIGAPCPSLMSEDRYAAQILSVVLGGGMSSRLFQSIREDLGLVYSIFASITPFKDCGYLNIYAGASTEQIEETIEATMGELARLKKEPVPAEELQRNKDQLKASLMLALESTSSRMSGLAQHEMTYGRFISPDEVIARVDAVTAEELHRLANEILRPESFGAIVLGDLEGFTLDRSQLEC
ncbi:MAG: M16 family metallopeptidase [Blastocatellia bacterium]